MEKKENKKSSKKKISNKSIFALIIVVCIGLAVFLISSQYKNFGSGNMTSKEINENSYNSSNIMRIDLSDIKSINFDLKTTDVSIQRSTTNPYIEYTKLYKGEDNVYDVKVNIDDGNIDITSDVKGDELYMKNKIQVVRIFLPMEGSIDEVKGKVGAGEVQISNLEAKNVDLTLESGSINIEDSYFNGNIKNNAGNISLVKSEMNNGSLITKSGDILAEDIKITDDVAFQTEIGSINVQTTDSIDKFNITAKLNVGNFVLGNISYRNINDGYKTENDAKRKIDLKTKIGDIIFNKGEGATEEEEEIFSSPEEESIQDDKNTNEIITPVDESIIEQNATDGDNEENN